jgi:catechol 2,3-dioxygenase
MTESFPPADMPSATEEGIHPDTREALLKNMNPYSEHGQG